MATYFLRLDRFEGPLDLLLHLIKLNEIDIFNIDIRLLTDQYVNYLRVVGFDDLGHEGEFLEMAATLVEIKVQMLLPGEDSPDHCEIDDARDLKESLEKRLLEYEQVRSAAELLSERQIFAREFWTNHEHERLEPSFAGLNFPLVGDSATLVILYEQLLNGLQYRKPPKVEATTHLVTVEEKSAELMKVLTTAKYALFQGFYPSFQSRYELVVNILAVLDLVRWQSAKVYQQELNGPLWLYRSDIDASSLPMKTSLAEPGGRALNLGEV